MRIERLGVEEWARLRDVRALRDAPDAFASTAKDALARGEDKSLAAPRRQDRIAPESATRPRTTVNANRKPASTSASFVTQPAENTSP